jgi:hypothetical protein
MKRAEKFKPGYWASVQEWNGNEWVVVEYFVASAATSEEDARRYANTMGLGTPTLVLNADY